MSFSASKLILLISLAAILASDQIIVKANNDNELVTDHYHLHESCANVLNEQVSWELYASMVYLNMAGYFDRPSVARIGYAKFFKAQSLEEYNHASSFIDYINSRNGTLKRISIDDSPKADWSSPREALADAIKLEKHVYAKLRHIHDVADQKCQDPHLMDFLESNYFSEQVDSIKELQTMLTTLEADESSGASVILHMEDVRLRKSKEL